MANKNEAKVRFTAETRDFNDEIKKSNKTMAELRAEMKLNEEQMKTNGVSAEGLQKKQKILTEQLAVSQDKTEALSQKVEKAVEIYGENSDEVSKLRIQLMNAQSAEEKIRQQIQNCNKELENQDESLEEVKDSAEDAGEGFTVLKGAMANLVSSGIQSAIGGLKDLASKFLNLSEETREIRKSFSLLNSSFDSAGLEAEDAKETLYALTGVLGDMDRATEASNLIAKMSKDEKDLQTNTRILTGVFAEYGNSIPTEGLAEAMSATASMSTVQGVLADALEWQGVNLDKFNEKLGKLKTEEERAALIQQTLTGLYGESADAYRENNQALIEANEAQLGYNENLAALGMKAEPITTGLKNGLSEVLSVLNNFASDVDFQAIATQIENGFKWFAEECLPKIVQGVQDFVGWLKDAKTWCEENTGVLIAVGSAIGIVTTAIGAYNVVQGVKSAMDAANVTTVWGLVAAHWAQATAAMAAVAPYILVVAAIAAVIAIIVLCIKYWDDIVAAVKNCWASVCETLSGWGTWIDENVIQPVVGFFTGLWDSIVGVFQGCIDWVKTNWKAIVLFITNPLAGVFKYLYDNFEGFRNFVNNVVEKVKGFFTNLWDGFKNGAKSAWEGVKSVFSAVGGFFSNVFGVVKDKIVSVFQAGGKVFNNIKDGIVSVFKTVVNGIIKGINTVVSAPFKGLNKILDKIHGVSVAGIKPFSWLTWRAPIPKIPLLAEGGILTKPTLNIAGEAGPEAVIPLDKLDWFISSAVERAMQNANVQALAYAINDLANRPIELNVNGRRFAVATASDTDAVNGQRISFAERGLAL